MDATAGADVRRAERALKETLEDADKPMEVETTPERRRTFTSLGFSRLRTEWSPEEQPIIETARDAAEKELIRHFADVYQILEKLYDTVRTPRVDKKTGEVLLDESGFPLWEEDEHGLPIEDWKRLTDREKEMLIHMISTRLVLWEQRAADLWGDAMLAKGKWEEVFADAFMLTGKVDNRRPTVDDRTQNAQSQARDDRYFAIFMAMRSKKADALVKSMERLCQRLRDTLG